MPFDKKFDDIYQLGIKQACEDSGAYCERVDEQIFQERILDRIFNQISKADIIVADMTNRNPNVFYEVGYAHALGKPTILLTSNSEDIPFDLKHFPHIIYNNKITTVKAELSKRIDWLIKNSTAQISEGKIPIDIYLGDKDLSKGDVIYETPKGSIPHPKLTIHNNSSQTLEPGSFHIGIISKKIYSHCRSTDIETTMLPNGSYQHMFLDFDTLFPDAYTSCQIALDRDDKGKIKSVVLVRVYTDVGTRDFNLTIVDDSNG